MLQLGLLLQSATRCYTLLRVVHALLRRASLLGTWLCNTLQLAVPTLLHPTRSNGMVLGYTQQWAEPGLLRSLATLLC